MADLSELQAAGNTKITGSDSVGNETNYLGVDVSGNVTSNVNVANASAVIVMQNAVAVTGNGTSLPTTGYGTSIIQITGTFVASIAFEASVDAGATWVAISATQIGQGDILNVATIPGLYRLTVTAIDLIRARVTWTSGTSITINGRSSNAVNASKIVKLATGINTIGSVKVTDGTNIASVLSAAPGTDTGQPAVAVRIISQLGSSSSLPTGASTATLQTTGNTSLASIDTKMPQLQNGSIPFIKSNTINTYSAQSPAIIPVTAAQDIFWITGSATKTIRVLRIGITATQTTAGTVSTFIIKRSTANSGGVPTTAINVPYDSNYPVPTATVISNTGSVTVGTPVGAINSFKMFIPTTDKGVNPYQFILDYVDAPVTLRGVAQCLSVNLNAATVSGGSYSIFIEWTEE